jgi:thiol-disulfide isomerase/thioredoxin
MRFTKSALAPGDRFPAFDLPVVTGGRLRLSELTASGPALVIFGSSTCPVTDAAAPGINELHREFADRVRFAMIDVREAHPGKTIPQPRTIEAKTANAEQLRRLHGFEFDVAVDDLDGTLHRALSPKPNSAYLVGADGTILFRAQWASDTKALAAAISSAVAGRPPVPAVSGGVVLPTLRMLPHLAHALDRAGRGAWADMWRVAPPLAAIGKMLQLLGAARTGGARSRSS